MKILVCLKVIKGEINPFDQSALECALKLSKDVEVISMGPESNKDVLLTLTRLGAKVTLITDKIFAGSDTLATSYILSKAIEKKEYDLILCGRQSIDGDTAQVGPMLAQRLNIALITNAVSLEVGDELIAQTRDGQEETKLPALVTMERSYVLRFPGIFSKVGEVKILRNEDLMCNPEKCGLKGSPTKVLQTFENEKGKRKCKFISVNEFLPLIEQLKSTKSEIIAENYAGEKLECVWAIGDEVISKAKEISKKTVLVEKQSPEELIKLIQKEKPEVILWNADLWGRKYAPFVAAALETGLCADCTSLEAENGKLIMYRPAQGGNITAKIKCETYPQMATVRTKTESSQIVLSGGKGANFEIIEELAYVLSAETGASRGLVDMNKAPYEKQIGLTGKNISPKIYIAIGISGAVHHTCGIEGAENVIAVNPDKDARIFEYSDYGVLTTIEELYDKIKIK